MAAHQMACQHVNPWDRRKVARAGGPKCERRAASKAWTALLAQSKTKRKEPLP
jgi:hypothetical protein